MLRPYNGENPDATHAGVTGYGFSGGWAYTIPAAHPPEMQAAAYKFAEFIGVHPQGGCAFLFAQGRPAPVKACNENPAYYDVNPYWSVVLEGLGDGHRRADYASARAVGRRSCALTSKKPSSA